MDPNPNLFDQIDLNNPPPNSVLGSKYLNPDYLFERGYNFFSDIYFYLVSPEGQETIKSLLFFLTLFFITIIMYVAVRMLEIRRKEHHHIAMEKAEYAYHLAEKERKDRENTSNFKNQRWARVLEYLFSSNEGDWKLAIIEADSMLEGLLDQLGFRGESIGDKLKSADPDVFRKLPMAWEVHTVRNRIAHEGSDYSLSSVEAKRVIALYEQIFLDFGYI
ncbi:MAG: hypothetical protein WD991_00485 [Candidatus Paceibacterota bacterium]